jgi:hypothetical protein
MNALSKFKVRLVAAIMTSLTTIGFHLPSAFALGCCAPLKM